MSVKIFNVIIIAAVVVLWSGSLTRVSVAADTRQVSGEIISIDLNGGTLKLKSDAAQGMGEITEYKIDQNEHRIMNSSDKTPLSIKDLQPGQYVTVDIINSADGRIVKKIVVGPGSASEHADENAKFKRSEEAFNSRENKEFRARRKAEKEEVQEEEAKQKVEDAQDNGKGQVEIKF